MTLSDGLSQGLLTLCRGEYLTEKEKNKEVKISNHLDHPKITDTLNTENLPGSHSYLCSIKPKTQ